MQPFGTPRRVAQDIAHHVQQVARAVGDLRQAATPRSERSEGSEHFWHHAEYGMMPGAPAGVAMIGDRLDGEMIRPLIEAVNLEFHWLIQGVSVVQNGVSFTISPRSFALSISALSLLLFTAPSRRCDAATRQPGAVSWC